MSSTHPDDQSEASQERQSAASLAQQNSAVSPLLSNIIGGANRFDSASETTLDSDPEASLEKSQPETHSAAVSLDDTAASSQDGQEDKHLEQPHEADSSPISASDSTANSSQSVSSDAFNLSDLTEQQRLPQTQPLQSLSEQYGDAGLLAELNALATAQQFQLEQHRAYLLRSRAEQSQQLENWQQRCNALESQLQETRHQLTVLEQRHLASQSQLIPLEAQRDAAQQVTERLQTEVLDHRQRRAGIEEQLDLAEVTLKEQQDITAAQSRSIVAMQAELSQAQAEVTALETRLAHQGNLRQQLKAEGDRDRQSRSKSRDRQLQLEQETTQMTGQLLRLSEELRQAQRQSKQWRRQAQTQTEQLQSIARWAAQSESVPAELMALLEPIFLKSSDAKSSDARAEEALSEELLLEHPMSEPQPSLGAELGTPGSSVPKSSQSSELSHVLDRNDLLEKSQTSEAHSSSLDLPNFPHGTT